MNMRKSVSEQVYSNAKKPFNGSSQAKGAVMIEYTIMALALAVVFWFAFAGTDGSIGESDNVAEKGVADVIQERNGTFRTRLHQP